MPLYTERNNLRKPIEKTYDIGPDAYNHLFKVCEKYLIYLAWEFPLYCPDDGASIYDYDRHSLVEELKFDIPSLLEGDDFVKACNYEDPFGDGAYINYDPFAILDFIEYVFAKMKDYEYEWHHSFFGHDHIRFLKTSTIRSSFLHDINKMLDRTGLLYTLTEIGEIERVVSNSMAIGNLKKRANECSDPSLKELVDEAVRFYLRPSSDNIEIAVEKIWDAFERAKTCYRTLNKKQSFNKLIADISHGQKEYSEVLEKEFKELTDIGNNFRIRHHETNKVDFISDEEREYFFNRCLALLLLIFGHVKELD